MILPAETWTMLFCHIRSSGASSRRRFIGHEPTASD